jgi:hypothetical protein
MIGVGVSVSAGEAEGANVWVANGIGVSELSGVGENIEVRVKVGDSVNVGDGAKYATSGGKPSSATTIVTIPVITATQIVASTLRVLAPWVFLLLVFRPISAS